MKTVSSENCKYFCKKCQKSFLKKSILKQHIWTVHEKKKLLKCDICAMSFLSNKKLNNHKNKASCKIVNFCKECNKSFRKKSILKKHIQSVHEKKKFYKCDICPKIYSTNRNLNNHKIKDHDRNTPLKCSRCDIVFRGKYFS